MENTIKIEVTESEFRRITRALMDLAAYHRRFADQFCENGEILPYLNNPEIVEAVTMNRAEHDLTQELWKKLIHQDIAQ